MSKVLQDPGINYEVREQIGKGAFGAAFLVVDKETKKEYVLKRVRLARQSQWQRQSTFQEMELVSSFRHPFIVPHIESWVQGGHTVNIVYGYCEKGDLASWLHKQKGAYFPEAQLAAWLAELLLALDYMHNMKVLHRDIKCSNIFMTARGDVQIGDFGLATFRDTGDENEDQSLVGTPHYMSPELLSNKGYSFKTDVWSLGCVMYELSALKPAFNAFNIQGLIDKIKKNKPPPITATYSPEWLALINRMLHKSPERRPSVRELLQAPVIREAVEATMSYIQDVMPGAPMPSLDPISVSPTAIRRTLSDSAGSDPEDHSPSKYRSTSHAAMSASAFLKQLQPRLTLQPLMSETGSSEDQGLISDDPSPVGTSGIPRSLGTDVPRSPSMGMDGMGMSHWRRSSGSFDSEVVDGALAATGLSGAGKRGSAGNLRGEKRTASVLERMTSTKAMANKTAPRRAHAMRSSAEGLRRDAPHSDEEADGAGNVHGGSVQRRYHRAVSAPPARSRQQGGEKTDKARARAPNRDTKEHRNTDTNRGTKEHRTADTNRDTKECRNTQSPVPAARVHHGSAAAGEQPSAAEPGLASLCRSTQAWAAKTNGRQQTPARYPPGLHTAPRVSSRQRQTASTDVLNSAPADLVSPETQIAAANGPAAGHGGGAATHHPDTQHNNFIMPANSATSPTPPAAEAQQPLWLGSGKGTGTGTHPGAPQLDRKDKKPTSSWQDKPAGQKPTLPATVPTPISTPTSSLDTTSLPASIPLNLPRAESLRRLTSRRSREQGESPTGNATPPVTDRVTDHTTPRTCAGTSLNPTPRSLSNCSELPPSLSERASRRLSEGEGEAEAPSERSELVSWHMQAIIRHMSSVMTLAAVQADGAGADKSESGEQVFQNVIYDEEGPAQLTAPDGSTVQLRTLGRLLSEYMGANQAGASAAPAAGARTDIAASITPPTQPPRVSSTLSPMPSPNRPTGPSLLPDIPALQSIPSAPSTAPPSGPTASTILQNLYRVPSNAAETHDLMGADANHPQLTTQQLTNNPLINSTTLSTSNPLLSSTALSTSSCNPLLSSTPVNASSTFTTPRDDAGREADGSGPGGLQATATGGQNPVPVITQELWMAQQHKFLFMQRVLSLVVKLYVRQRYHEVGNVLSSPLLAALGVNPPPLPPPPPPADPQAPAALFNIGDFVFVGSRRRMKGVIRYFGPSHWDNEDWVGLQFDEAVPFQGKTNGTVGGIRYFDAPAQCGLFVKATTLKPEHERNGAK